MTGDRRSARRPAAPRLLGALGAAGAVGARAGAAARALRLRPRPAREARDARPSSRPSSAPRPSSCTRRSAGSVGTPRGSSTWSARSRRRRASCSPSRTCSRGGSGRCVADVYSPGHDPSTFDVDAATLDLSHAAVAGRDALDLALALGPRLRHVHLCDGVLSTRPGGLVDQHLVPGTGTQPVAEVLAHLARSGWSGSVVAEVHASDHRDRRTPRRRGYDIAAAHASPSRAALAAGTPLGVRRGPDRRRRPPARLGRRAPSPRRRAARRPRPRRARRGRPPPRHLDAHRRQARVPEQRRQRRPRRDEAADVDAHQHGDQAEGRPRHRLEREVGGQVVDRVGGDRAAGCEAQQLGQRRRPGPRATASASARPSEWAASTTTKRPLANRIVPHGTRPSRSTAGRRSAVATTSTTAAAVAGIHTSTPDTSAGTSSATATPRSMKSTRSLRGVRGGRRRTGPRARGGSGGRRPRRARRPTTTAAGATRAANASGDGSPRARSASRLVRFDTGSSIEPAVGEPDRREGEGHRRQPHGPSDEHDDGREQHGRRVERQEDVQPSARATTAAQSTTTRPRAARAAALASQEKRPASAASSATTVRATTNPSTGATRSSGASSSSAVSTPARGRPAHDEQHCSEHGSAHEASGPDGTSRARGCRAAHLTAPRAARSAPAGGCVLRPARVTANGTTGTLERPDGYGGPPNPGENRAQIPFQRSDHQLALLRRQPAQEPQSGPRDWRLLLTAVAWAATTAIAVGNVVEAANEND